MLLPAPAGDGLPTVPDRSGRSDTASKGPPGSARRTSDSCITWSSSLGVSVKACVHPRQQVRQLRILDNHKRETRQSIRSASARPHPAPNRSPAQSARRQRSATPQQPAAPITSAIRAASLSLPARRAAGEAATASPSSSASRVASAMCTPAQEATVATYARIEKPHHVRRAAREARNPLCRDGEQSAARAHYALSIRVVRTPFGRSDPAWATSSILSVSSSLFSPSCPSSDSADPMSEIISRDTRVDWAAIFAGAVVATAIGVILTTFGLGLGLAVNSPYEGEGSSPALFAIGAGVWLLLTQVARLLGRRIHLRPAAPAPARAQRARSRCPRRPAWHHRLGRRRSCGGPHLDTRSSAARQRPLKAQIAAASSKASPPQPMLNSTRPQPRNASTTREAANESFTERRAEVARKLTVLSAFMTAASLLVGACRSLLCGRQRRRPSRQGLPM